MAAHNWEPCGLCIFCGLWCPNCNDCVCPYKGWTNYRRSRCPGFDTQAGALRPVRGEAGSGNRQ